MPTQTCQPTLYYISSSITNLTRDTLHLEPHLPRFCIRPPNTLHEYGNIEYTSNQYTFTGEQRMNTLPQAPRSQPSRAYIGSSLVGIAAPRRFDKHRCQLRLCSMPRIPASKAGFGADGDVAGQRKRCTAARSARFRQSGGYFFLNNGLLGGG